MASGPSRLDENEESTCDTCALFAEVVRCKDLSENGRDYVESDVSAAPIRSTIACAQTPEEGVDILELKRPT